MCLLWEKWCVSSISVCCVKEERQAIVLLPYTVLLCNLSSVLLGISLHSNFSGALVSPSLAATSTLEIEYLPICISSLFASYSLPHPPFFSPLYLLPRAEGSWLCASQSLAGSAEWQPAIRLLAPERTACFTLCTPCAAVCLFFGHLVMMVWSTDCLRWAQEAEMVSSERFDLTFFCSWSYTSPT